MKQRNIPNRHREGLPLPSPAPYLTPPSPTRVVPSNLESIPGWAMRKDWSNQMCLLWVPHLLPKILLL